MMDQDTIERWDLGYGFTITRHSNAGRVAFRALSGHGTPSPLIARIRLLSLPRGKGVIDGRERPCNSSAHVSYIRSPWQHPGQP